MKRLIFHIDVNSAFLSWEAVRRISRGEDDIRLIPSAVGGERTKRTGVILAKSIPAKKYGIKTGEPVAMALRKCPDLFVVKPDFKLYAQKSAAFTDICRKFAPVVEKYSIDECFLDMSGTHLLYPDPVAIAHIIKDAIHSTLGFTVNIGIGDCKLLAKMASDFEKPDKVHTLFRREIRRKMWSLPVSSLFSVGRSTAEKLVRAGIRTIGDLAGRDLLSVQRLVGIKLGRQLHDYANGIDPSPVLAAPAEAKGYSNSTTLEEDVTTSAQAHKILLALADNVTSRMRADGAKALCISVTIRSNNFNTHSHQRKLDIATDITSEVYQISKTLFSELWNGSTPLRLLGISLTNITKDTFLQLSLFTDARRERSQRLDKATDAIRNRYGADTIVRASSIRPPFEIGKKHRAQMELSRKPQR